MPIRVSTRNRRPKSFPNCYLLDTKNEEQSDPMEIDIKNKVPKNKQRKSGKFSNQNNAEKKSKADEVLSEKHIMMTPESPNSANKKRRSQQQNISQPSLEETKKADQINNSNEQQVKDDVIGTPPADAKATSEQQVYMKTGVPNETSDIEAKGSNKESNSIGRRSDILIKENKLLNQSTNYSDPSTGDGILNMPKQNDYILAGGNPNILLKVQQETLPNNALQNQPKILYITPEQLSILQVTHNGKGINIKGTFNEHKQSSNGSMHNSCSCLDCYSSSTSRQCPNYHQHKSHPYARVAPSHGHEDWQGNHQNFENNLCYDQKPSIPHENASSSYRSTYNYNGHHLQTARTSSYKSMESQWEEKIHTKNRIIKSLMAKNKKLKEKCMHLKINMTISIEESLDDTKL